EVEQARRDLPELVAHRVAVLADHQHPVAVVDGEDRHGAGVPDVLAVEAHPLGEVDGVAHEVEDHPLVQPAAGGDGPLPGLVAQRRALLDAHACSFPPVSMMSSMPAGAAGADAAADGATGDDAAGGAVPAASGSTSSSRVDFCRSTAAPISPANSGCARVGRDVNSGWACVPRKNGCTAGSSSTNSTRERPSSRVEVPERRSPASSSLSR